MSSGQDLIQEIMELRKELRHMQKALPTYGRIYAEAEMKHSVAFAQAILLEKDNKTPATLIEKLVKGKPSIAELKFNMDVAEVNYMACDKAIDSLKKEMGVLDSQINREWGKGN